MAAAVAERTFRLLSLSFLTIGFLVGVAGADNNGENAILDSTEVLVRELNDVEEVNEINQGNFKTPYLVGDVEKHSIRVYKHTAPKPLSDTQN